MGLWMSAKTALQRVIEDEKAPIMVRVRALRQVEHPELAMLRRLLVAKTRTTPVPAKLKALASLKYVQELSLRKLRKQQKAQSNYKSGNALGV
jgi:hypothetical protein